MYPSVNFCDFKNMYNDKICWTLPTGHEYSVKLSSSAAAQKRETQS